jgi:hypothetical protein
METYEQKIHFYYSGLKRTLITFLLRVREITSRSYQKHKKTTRSMKGVIISNDSASSALFFFAEEVVV